MCCLHVGTQLYVQEMAATLLNCAASDQSELVLRRQSLCPVQPFLDITVGAVFKPCTCRVQACLGLLSQGNCKLCHATQGISMSRVERVERVTCSPGCLVQLFLHA